MPASESGYDVIMFEKLKEYFAMKKVEKAVMESPIHLIAMKAGLEANIETGMDKAVQKNKRIGGVFS